MLKKGKGNGKVKGADDKGTGKDKGTSADKGKDKDKGKCRKSRIRDMSGRRLPHLSAEAIEEEMN